jgi:4-azaleucine resistance transporter AzlC
MSRSAYVNNAIVIGAATGVFGVAFGVLAATNDLTVAKTMAMSLLVFTGASQFAAVGVVGAGGSEATALGSALLLGARNGFYGVALAEHLRGRFFKRMVGSQLVIDESTALSLSQERAEDTEPAFWAGGLSVFFFWNLGTLLGAIGGESIGDPEALGLDAAFPAGFISLAAPAFGHRRGIVAAAAGALIAIAATPITRPGVPIVLAAAGAIVALFVPGGTAPSSTDEAIA